jgi:hypothetical protein
MERTASSRIIVALVMMLWSTYRISASREVFRTQPRLFLKYGSWIVGRRRKMLGIKGEVVVHRIVFVETFFEFCRVRQVVRYFWMPRDDMSSDEFCRLEWFVAQSAAALFGIIDADMHIDDAFVGRITLTQG